MLPGVSPSLNAALSFVQGDYFPGIPEINITPIPANPVASCRFQIRSQNINKPTSQSFANGSGITILSNANWQFSIPAVACSLLVGKYNYQFETTDNTGIVATLFEGVLEITKDYVTP